MRLPFDLDGPAPAWPRPLDAALERWAALPGRARALARTSLVVVLLLAATGGLLDGRWGPPRPVLVATRAIAPGLPLTPGDVVPATWPRDLVPPGALTSVDLLPDRAVAHGAVSSGAVLTADNVRAAAAIAEPGSAAVPVPASILPALPVGTTVDVAATTLDGRARIIARGATVVADDGEWRWLQVTRAEVADVAAGINAGSLVAAVVNDD